MTTLAYTTTLARLTCGDCHVPFAIPDNLHTDMLASGRGIWCPNGHRISYYESEIARLRRERTALERERDAARVSRDAARDQAEAAERRRRAAKGQLTKVKRRVANGVCPVCNRTFTELGRHMAGQHPDYTDSEKAHRDD